MRPCHPKLDQANFSIGPLCQLQVKRKGQRSASSRRISHH
ncbi:hypothetical protein CORC01_02114 [Colletotrichum orchidophilum]|uniref:Uncharacterized protein n=1 Tax=Colletotrichum orchidophilum TaxID=1209926 RepID=A0A1G4BN36_9PEZI|nr:uncharacterized protein CORC01_02114 [Colletotrichum orchidophilum]OHF02718.1 hypothetical protein CORC01_02114 [Colletotrichum orchidophilum]